MKKLIAAVAALISTAMFATANQVVVTSPNGGESFLVRQVMVGSFVTDAPIGSVYDVSIVGHRTSPTNIVDRQIGFGNIGNGTQEFAAVIPDDLPAGDDYRIRVVVECPGFFAQDQSDSNFTISANTNSITVIRPNETRRWAVGSSQFILWESSGIAKDYNVQIGIIDTRYDGEDTGRREQTIAFLIPNTGGFEWTVPASIGQMDLTSTDQSVYRIVVYSWADTVTGYAISDYSDASFAIVTNQPSIALLNDSDEHWVAGTTHGVKFATSGLAPDGGVAVMLIPVGKEDGGIKISSLPVTADGNDGDVFTLPIDLPSGEYNLLLVASSPAYGKYSYAVRGLGVITVTSTITSPAAGENLRAGKKYTATWAGREDKVRLYDVYLINIYSKGFGAEFLGQANAQSGSFGFSIPHKASPGKGYRLWFFKPDSRGFTSDDFNIVHDNRNSNR